MRRHSGATGFLLRVYGPYRCLRDGYCISICWLRLFYLSCPISSSTASFRYFLHTDRALIPLQDEMEIVKAYLEIESLRFEERLSVEYNVSAEAEAVPIPAMMLQTLVENAITHGIADLPRGGLVKIDGSVGDGMLLLEVTNSRRVGAPKHGEGTGLRNSAERLRLIFGPRAAIGLDLSQPDSAAARIQIPVSP